MCIPQYIVQDACVASTHFVLITLQTFSAMRLMTLYVHAGRYVMKVQYIYIYTHIHTSIYIHVCQNTYTCRLASTCMRNLHGHTQVCIHVPSQLKQRFSFPLTENGLARVVWPWLFDHESQLLYRHLPPQYRHWFPRNSQLLWVVPTSLIYFWCNRIRKHIRYTFALKMICTYTYTYSCEKHKPLGMDKNVHKTNSIPHTRTHTCAHKYTNVCISPAWYEMLWGDSRVMESLHGRMCLPEHDFSIHYVYRHTYDKHRLKGGVSMLLWPVHEARPQPRLCQDCAWHTSAHSRRLLPLERWFFSVK